MAKKTKGNFFPLTSLQRSLLKEINEVLSVLGLNTDEIVQTTSGEHRTVTLRLVRDKAIRGEVIETYTLIDTMLEGLLRRYYFRGGRGSIKNFRKSKRVQKFDLLLQELSLIQKLRQAKRIVTIPKAVARNIERLNGIRNVMAHSFYQERGRLSSKYKGQDIFSLAGLLSFRQDVESIIDFFHPEIAAFRRNEESEHWLNSCAVRN